MGIRVSVYRPHWVEKGHDLWPWMFEGCLCLWFSLVLLTCLSLHVSVRRVSGQVGAFNVFSSCFSGNHTLVLSHDSRTLVSVGNNASKLEKDPWKVLCFFFGLTCLTPSTSQALYLFILSKYLLLHDLLVVKAARVVLLFLWLGFQCCGCTFLIHLYGTCLCGCECFVGNHWFGIWLFLAQHQNKVMVACSYYDLTTFY